MTLVGELPKIKPTFNPNYLASGHIYCGVFIMKEADLKVYRARLVALERRLQGDVAHLANAALNPHSGDASTAPLHMADVGSDNYDQEFTLSLMKNEGETLEAIREALTRIDDGTYGVCAECDKTIPKMRLSAIPYAALCINCATKLDRS